MTEIERSFNGLTVDVTDPAGIVTHTERDALGRTTLSIESYGASPLKNKTVQYAYGPAGMVSLTAVDPGGADQETAWVYGVTTTGGGSAINSNDVAGATQHPDPTTGSASSDEQDVVTVDAMGRTKTSTDRNGTTHQYTYNALDQLVLDAVTAFGTDVDQSVAKIAYAYDTLGNLYLITSYDGSDNVVNQTLRQFNGFGQMVREYQSTQGEVGVGTPFVKYDWSEASGGNHSRLTKITYPDGYELSYDYESGLGDNVSRLTSISDSTGTLEELVYQGDSIVGRNHPQPDLNMSTGFDDFGRVTDLDWKVGSTSVSHYDYGYDKAGNRLYREDKVNGDFSELYGYDTLNQLTSFARGELNGGKDAIASPTTTQTWDLSALGNWDSVSTDGTPESRTSNAQNEYTAVGGNTPEYDANGNMTVDQAGRHLKWDAWNRLVAVYDTDGTSLIKAYTYDGLNRRVTDSDGVTTTDLYYSANWQVLEERTRAATDTPDLAVTSARYVWSPAYVDAMILRDRDTDADGILDERLWAVQDANWNVVAVVNGNGDVVERYAYTPYGVPTVMDETYTTIGSSAYEWKHLHQGLAYDAASELYANRFRWYSATLGQFVSNDPIGFNAGDVNVRRYLGNSSINISDPSGLEPVETAFNAPFPLVNNIDNLPLNLDYPKNGGFLRSSTGRVYNIAKRPEYNWKRTDDLKTITVYVKRDKCYWGDLQGENKEDSPWYSLYKRHYVKIFRTEYQEYDVYSVTFRTYVQEGWLILGLDDIDNSVVDQIKHQGKVALPVKEWSDRIPQPFELDAEKIKELVKAAAEKLATKK